MSKYFLVSEHYAEIKRQLYADMKAQIELGETFHAKYALAGGLAALGIYIINKGKN